jgi:protein-disulfide isomerase
MINKQKFTLVPLVMLATAVTAQDLSEDDVKRLALEAILENPEVIMEAVAILQARDEKAAAENAARTLSELRQGLEQDPNAPVLGNPDGDVTLVEFFDYNCAYCKKAAAEVEALIDEDDNIRLVFREWPILGDGSDYAARAALAARNQGKYQDFHWEMMRLPGQANEVSVLRVAKKLGLDIEVLKEDMKAPEVEDHIQKSMEYARRLGFSGTPSFVVGNALVPGLVQLRQLQQLVAETRADQ